MSEIIKRAWRIRLQALGCLTSRLSGWFCQQGRREITKERAAEKECRVNGIEGDVGDYQTRLAHTLAGLGLSDFSVVRVVLSAAISAVFVGLIWFWRGEMEAITKASDIVFYGLAFVSVAFIPLFLWNLWLAPYRILTEKFEVFQKSNSEKDNAPGAIVSEVEVSHWEGTGTFRLGDAACLWVGIEPHNPITEIRAKAKFATLSGAVVNNSIRSSFSDNAFLRFIAGNKEKWPDYNQEVHAVFLRQYADKIGDVPLFLKSVQAPPTVEEMVAEAEKAENDGA